MPPGLLPACEYQGALRRSLFGFTGGDAALQLDYMPATRADPAGCPFWWRGRWRRGRDPQQTAL